MPQRKEYQMLFSLSASLGTGFNSAFASAQATIHNLQRQIESYNKALSDIKAYEKQRADVEKTEQKLQALKEKLDAVKQALSEEGGATSANKTKKADLEHQIDNANKKLDEQQQKLQRTSEALQKEGVDTSNLAGETQRLQTEIGNLRKKQDEATESAEKYGEKAQSSINAVTQAIIASGLLDALKALADQYKACIDIATGFEWSMVNVKALAGATAEEYASLTDKAKQLGADTRYTATESADAMGYMAMAGWKTKEMLEGMDGVIMLAAAANEDLATTSSIVTDSLNAFNMKASDTKHFADVLAAGATNSNTTVSLMGNTFKYTASSAGALGYSIEDVATAIMLMANRGIKGNMAGTALRLALSKLAQGATLTSQAFGEYNFTSVKADGTMKSFKDTLEELREQFALMTPAEKVLNAQNIAGVRSYNGLLAMLNATDEEYNRLRASIDNCQGAAEEMANIKMESLQGDFYLLTSATDALRTSLGELWHDEIRGLYQESKGLVDEINLFVKANPRLIKTVMVLVTTFGTLLTSIVAVNAGVKALEAALALLGIGSGMVATIAAVAAVTAGMYAMVDAMIASRDVSDELLPSFQDHEAEIANLQQEYDALVASGQCETEQAMALKIQIFELNEAFEQNRTTIGEFSSRIDSLHNKFLTLTEDFEKTKGEASDTADDSKDLADILTYLSSKADLTDADIAVMASMVDKLNASYDGLGLTLDSTTGRLNKTGAAIKSFVAGEEERAQQQARADYLTGILSNYGAQKESAEVAAKEAAEAYRKFDEAQKKWEASHPNVTGQNNWNGNVLRLWNEYIDLSNKSKEAAQNFEETRNAAAKTYGELGNDADKVKEFLDALDSGGEVSFGFSQEEQDRITEFLTDLDLELSDAQTVLSSLELAYNNIYESASKSILSQYELWDEVDSKVKDSKTSIDDMTKSMQSQIDYWQEYNQNLEKLREMSTDPELEGLSQVIASFADGSADSVAAIKGMADADPTKLKEMITTFKDLRKEQDTVSENIAQLATNYDKEVADLVSNIEKEVGKLGKLPEDAQKYGDDTIANFVEAADNSVDRVYNAYKAIADAASRGLHSSSLTMSGISLPSASPNENYASGTDYASRGVHLVGEEGPELVYFRGGEKVLNSRETALQAKSGALGGDVVNDVTVNFRIDGGADSRTVDMLRRFEDEFAERVLDVVASAGSDNARRAFA